MRSIWQTCLATVERIRSHAVCSQNEKLAKQLVLRATIFARMMVNTSVRTTEQWYANWVKTGRYPAFHRAECIALRRWVAKTDCLAFLQLTDWQQWRELQKVHGLGPAKAAMAVGLLGGKLACIDRHVYAYFTVQDSQDVVDEYRRNVTARMYQKLHYKFFGADGTARDTQWRLFERQVPAFAESGHWPYFQSVLDLV